jgi:hypothetical protein
VALELARKCLSETKSFEVLLELGLQTANASSIQDWLKCVLHPLGARRLVHDLARRLSDYPKAVASARYWLSGLLSQEDRERLKADLKRLADAA